jgi:hypothetical protein
MSDLGAAEAKLAIKLIELAVKQGWFDKLKDALKKKHRIIVGSHEKVMLDVSI